jgi:transcriptional regulator with XRE-family HTH domain
MIFGTRAEILKILGKNIRAARLEENITQEEAAKRSGVSLKALRNLEEGKNTSVLTLISVCRTINKIDWIQQIAPPEFTFERLQLSDPTKKRIRASSHKKNQHKNITQK